jgi:hypothetical protein
MRTYIYLSSNTANAKHLRDRVEAELAKHGFTSLRSDSALGSEFMSEIGRHLITADFVIADISDQNPNLFYELGITVSSKKPLILLVNKNANVKFPSDLSDRIFIPYNDIFSQDLIPSILNIIKHSSF